MANTLTKTQQPSAVRQGPAPIGHTHQGDAQFTRVPVFTKSAVADLTAEEIRAMSSEELTAVIRAADVPLFREHVTGHLRFLDRATLEPLAFLARRTIRNLECRNCINQ